MITTNDTKKALIAKLLEDKHITIDDAYMLLDEPVATREFVPMPYVQPINNWPWVYPYQQPYYLHPPYIVTCGTSGTLTNTAGGPVLFDNIYNTTNYNCKEYAGSTLTYSHLSPTGPVYTNN